FLGLDGRVIVTDYTADRDSCTAGTPQAWSDKSVASTLGLYPYDMAADSRRRSASGQNSGATTETDRRHYGLAELLRQVARAQGQAQGRPMNRGSRHGVFTSSWTSTARFARY